MIPPPLRSSRRPALAVLLLGLLALVSSAGLASGPFAAGPEERPQPARDAKADAAITRTLCASCHALPAPDVLPRASWRGSITKMSLIRDNKDVPGWGRGAAGAVALPADMEAAARYYEANAPTALASLESWPAVETGGPRFSRHKLGFPDALSPEPAVANVRFADLEGDARLEIVVCDMRQGVVLVGRPYAPAQPLAVLAEIPNPDHAEVADLDGDGIKDLLVADLGGFLPSDHDKGQAVWLRGNQGGGFTTYAMGGFPRVADVEAADFDGDGRQDLLVAGFGWRRTGGITLLRNRTVNPRQPAFDRVKLDERPGAIHLAPVDLDGDGRMDFVALVSQEHESVEAFVNEGAGKFRREVLYRAPHPNWGSSGLRLVDFDRDGDLDVLVTNGDMFDDDILKPYHGIRWLENQGGLHFVEHPLARLAGVHRALAVDLDGDGDLDVVAAAFTPGASSTDPKLPSLVWLEQTKPGQWKRHTLETGRLTHATLDAADYDGDGDVDLAVGNFLEGKPADTWVEVWENLGTGPTGRPR